MLPVLGDSANLIADLLLGRSFLAGWILGDFLLGDLVILDLILGDSSRTHRGRRWLALLLALARLLPGVHC
jgi:hypothetical protein